MGVSNSRVLFLVSLEQKKEDASEIIQQTEKNKQDSTAKEAEVREAYAALKAKLEQVGNLVHDSVPVDKDEVSAISFLQSQKLDSCGGEREIYLWCFNVCRLIIL